MNKTIYCPNCRTPQASSLANETNHVFICTNCNYRWMNLINKSGEFEYTKVEDSENLKTKTRIYSNYPQANIKAKQPTHKHPYTPVSTIKNHPKAEQYPKSNNVHFPKKTDLSQIPRIQINPQATLHKAKYQKKENLPRKEEENEKYLTQIKEPSTPRPKITSTTINTTGKEARNDSIAQEVEPKTIDSQDYENAKIDAFASYIENVRAQIKRNRKQPKKESYYRKLNNQIIEDNDIAKQAMKFYEENLNTDQYHKLPIVESKLVSDIESLKTQIQTQYEKSLKKQAGSPILKKIFTLFKISSVILLITFLYLIKDVFSPIRNSLIETNTTRIDTVPIIELDRNAPRSLPTTKNPPSPLTERKVIYGNKEEASKEETVINEIAKTIETKNINDILNNDDEKKTLKQNKETKKSIGTQNKEPNFINKFYVKMTSLFSKVYVVQVDSNWQIENRKNVFRVSTVIANKHKKNLYSIDTLKIKVFNEANMLVNEYTVSPYKVVKNADTVKIMISLPNVSLSASKAAVEILEVTTIEVE